jgi:hypothetical protein
MARAFCMSAIVACTPVVTPDDDSNGKASTVSVPLSSATVLTGSVQPTVAAKVSVSVGAVVACDRDAVLLTGPLTLKLAPREDAADLADLEVGDSIYLCGEVGGFGAVIVDFHSELSRFFHREVSHL